MREGQRIAPFLHGLHLVNGSDVAGLIDTRYSRMSLGGSLADRRPDQTRVGSLENFGGVSVHTLFFIGEQEVEVRGKRDVYQRKSFIKLEGGRV